MKTYEFVQTVYRLVTLFYLVVVPLAALYIGLKVAIATYGVAYVAYPCIDTFPNEVCNAVLALVTGN